MAIEILYQIFAGSLIGLFIFTLIVVAVPILYFIAIMYMWYNSARMKYLMELQTDYMYSLVEHMEEQNARK